MRTSNSLTIPAKRHCGHLPRGRVHGRVLILGKQLPPDGQTMCDIDKIAPIKPHLLPGFSLLTANIIPVVLVIVTTLLAHVLAQEALAEQSNPQEEAVTVATIAGAPVHYKDVQATIARNPHLLRNHTDASGDLLYEKALAYHIDRELLLQAARRLMPDFAGTAVDERAHDYFGSHETLQSVLEQSNLSVEAYNRHVVEERLIREYIKKQMKRITRKDILQVYTSQQRFRREPGRFRVAQILIAVSEDEKESEARANEILQIARTTPDQFGSIARQHSDGPARKNGGILENVAFGRMIPEIDNAVRNAQVGEIIGPVRSRFGYHVLKVVEKSPGRARSLAEVRRRIKGYLYRQRFHKTREALAAMLRN